MATQIVKTVYYALTPVKHGSSLVNLIPSPHDIKKKALSAVSSRSLMLNNNSFASPDLELKSCCSLKGSSRKYHSPSQPFNERSMILDNKVSRCLFSPKKISRKLEYKNIILYEPTVLSFDTTHRMAVTPNKISSKRYIVLGRGSFGLVVKGKYKNSDVAVKIIKTQHFKNEINFMKVNNIMKSEMNALKLHHPNIVQVYKVVASSNVNYVLMELCNQTNLENIIRREIMIPLVKWRYLSQIGNALDYCHQRGILHLDVKPKNVIVNVMNTSCKLCDFGSSKKIDDVNKPENNIRGTLKYTAPELLKGGSPTIKADIYSFGITMWQTIYQEVPYGKEDNQTVIYKVVNQNYRPRSQVITHKLEGYHLCEACWQAEPDQRPLMSNVLKTLEEIQTKFL